MPSVTTISPQNMISMQDLYFVYESKELLHCRTLTVPFLNRLLSAWRDKVALGDPDNGYFFYDLARDINNALKSENSTISQEDEVTFGKFLWYILYQKKHNK